MKNELGRKITSLTLMTIMLAWGLTVAGPLVSDVEASSFDGASDTSGMLSVSSTHIQGGAVLGIYVNDPAIAALDQALTPPVVTFGGKEVAMSQLATGDWAGYIVDKSTVENLMDKADLTDQVHVSNSSGLEYGMYCGSGLSNTNISGSAAPTVNYDIVGVAVWAQLEPDYEDDDAAGGDANTNTYCKDADNATGNDNRELMFTFLGAAPAVNFNTGGTEGGQRGHVINATSGHGSWPFIQGNIDFAGSNAVNYGNDSVTVYYGNTDAVTSISIANLTPSENAEVQVTIVDPGMNWDPTLADVWELDLEGSDWPDNENFAWAGNNTGEALSGQMVHASSNSAANGDVTSTAVDLTDFGCGSNCVITSSADVNKYLTGHSSFILRETGASTGVFETFDSDGDSGLNLTQGIAADTAITLSYGGNSDTMLVTYNTASASFTTSDSWLPAETAVYTLTDMDLNRNSMATETLAISDPHARIPTITIGDPITLYHVSKGIGTGGAETAIAGSSGTLGMVMLGTQDGGTCLDGASGGCGYYTLSTAANTTDASKRLRIIATALEGEESDATTHWLNITMNGRGDANNISALGGTPYLQYDITALTDQLVASDVNVYLEAGMSPNNASGTLNNACDGCTSPTTLPTITLVSSGNSGSGFVDLNEGGAGAGLFDEGSADTWSFNATNTNTKLAFEITHQADADLCSNFNDGTGVGADRTNAKDGAEGCDVDIAVAADIVNWDQNNGTLTHNGIYRIEAVETGNDTGVFTGTVNYVYLNAAEGIICTDPANGNESPTACGFHNGSDTNMEGLIEPFTSDVTVVLSGQITGASAPRVNYNDTDAAQAAGTIGKALDTEVHTGIVEFDQSSYAVGDMATLTITDPDLNQDPSIRETYTNSSNTFLTTTTKTSGTAEQTIAGNQILVETSNDSSVFVAAFTIPDKVGHDLDVEYKDSLDSTNAAVSVFATAGISSTTGSISLDRTVYPVPWSDNKLNQGDDTTYTNTAGEVTYYVQITEPDNTADTLCAKTATAGSETNSCTVDGSTIGTAVVKIDSTTIATLGGDKSIATSGSSVVELGPLSELEQGGQVYEVSGTLGDSNNTTCSNTSNTALTCTPVYGTSTNYPINSTSIIQVSYTDPRDGDGTAGTTVYDSATFDLRTGTLTVDKDVYVIGQDMVITLTDPDLNLDSDSAESYAMNLIQWDSAADSDELLSTTTAFTSNPSSLAETGSNTGVFQTVTTIPAAITGGSGTSLAAGEAVTLTYRDVGLSGEKSVQDDEADIEATFTISDFGAIVELDKAVYDWTDTVAITVTAPDHNQNTNSAETIGTSALPINANTRAGKMCSGTTSYTLSEGAADSGVFEGEIALTGFAHTVATSQSYTPASNSCTGSTSGKLQTAGNMDGVTVSFEWKDGSVALASAIVQWNIGAIEFLDSNVSPGGSSVIRVTDVDEDVDSGVVDTFKIDVYSDSDSGGFTVTLSETDEGTGVFEGTIHFSADAATSGTNLRVSEGDTVTAEYTDKTLPGPDYTTADDLTIAATTTVGTVTAPLERAPAANARVVDAFGSSVAEVSVDQQVQIAADVANSQDKDQSFAYLVQVQDGNGVTVSLAWITGSLTAGQSMSPALSWTPDAAGSYTATVFVWESVDNPTALSPTVSVTIDVV